MATLYEKAVHNTERMLASEGKIVPAVIIFSKFKVGITTSSYTWTDKDSQDVIEHLIKKGLGLRKIAGIIMIDEVTYRAPTSKHDSVSVLVVAWDLINNYNKEAGIFPIHRKAGALIMGNDLRPEDVPTWLDPIIQTRPSS